VHGLNHRGRGAPASGAPRAGGGGGDIHAHYGLVASETPLTSLPGGSTNVWCAGWESRTTSWTRPSICFDRRRLPPAASQSRSYARRPLQRCRSIARAPLRLRLWRGARRLGGRAGRRTSHRKTRFGAWYYALAALAVFNRRYLVNPPVVRVTASELMLTGVTVVVPNSDLFTYFRGVRFASPSRPGSRRAPCQSVLKRATAVGLPSLIPRLPSTRARIVLRTPAGGGHQRACRHYESTPQTCQGCFYEVKGTSARRLKRSRERWRLRARSASRWFFLRGCVGRGRRAFRAGAWRG
jgi:hypothetical protein